MPYSGKKATFDHVTSVIGEEAASLLVLIYGGVRLLVPTHWSHESILVRRFAFLVGEEKTKALIEVFGGNAVEIPKRVDLESAALRVRVKEAVLDGMKIRDVALNFHLTERAVRLIVNA